MVCEWGQDVQLQETMCLVSARPTMGEESLISQYLLRRPSDPQGTVEAVALARQDAVDDLHSDTYIRSDSWPFDKEQAFYSYVFTPGRHFTALARDEAHMMEEWKYSEIISLFEHSQSTSDPVIFAEITWFETLNTVPIGEDAWADFPEIDIKFHLRNTYAKLNPKIAVIPFRDIHCHVAHGVYDSSDPEQWFT
ncbi:hypothetical protein JB92DRAFT_2837065 [Gautieria morchelliformis]|nr:hypothetical protein JB92DRAFT_2837065 [Gautieria morchelliformis]